MRKTLWVSPAGTNWKVHWEKETDGSMYPGKEDAIKKAKQMVRELPAGQVASIRVQRADGTIQTEWSYGSDPYPPIG